MPDRQRHGRLSDSGAPPARAGRHRGTASAKRAEAAAADEEQSMPSYWDRDDERLEPVRPYEPLAATTERSRSALDLSDPQSDAAHRPDPMADTTRLRRVVSPRPEPGPDDDDDDTVDIADLDPADTADATGATGLDADLDGDPYGDFDADLDPADDEPTRPWSARSLLTRHRRRLAMSAAGIVALAALLALPPVRAQLRDSFTRLPKPYTALYFTAAPQINGTVLTVPVGVHAVDADTGTYIVRAWTVDAQGRTDDSRSAALKWDGQALTTVVSLPVSPTAVSVWVSLDSSTETLHYKIAV